MYLIVNNNVNKKEFRIFEQKIIYYFLIQMKMCFMLKVNVCLK